MGGQPAPPEASVRRPVAVTILAALRLLTAAAYAIVAVALLTDRTAALETLLGPGAVEETPVGRFLEAGATLTVIGLAIASFIAGILLLRMQQLGWTLTMLLAGVSLASSILLWWAEGLVNSLSLTTEVVTVFYLNQRQVREAFGITRRRLPRVARASPG
jgi:hypothetical protein